jgi:hypothetical protein
LKAWILPWLFLCGCATATFDKLPPQPAPLTAAHFGPLQLKVVKESFLGDADGNWTDFPFPLGLLEREALAALRDSRLFSEIGPSVADSDFSGTLTIRRYQGVTHRFLLSLGTAFVVPSDHDRRIVIEVKLASKRSGEFVCERDQEFKAWYTLFVVPYTFTRAPARYEFEVVRRLTLDCFQELLEELRTTQHAH